MPELDLRPARPAQFDVIARLLSAATVPPAIAATTEFSSLCPDTADCLWRDLTT